jgi:hypothetical protein
MSAARPKKGIFGRDRAKTGQRTAHRSSIVQHCVPKSAIWPSRVPARSIGVKSLWACKFAVWIPGREADHFGRRGDFYHDSVIDFP